MKISETISGFTLKILFAVFILFCGSSAIYGCTCPGRELRMTFKETKAIFIGKLPDNDLPAKMKIQGAQNGTVLKVEKSWKGVKGNYFSVLTKFEKYGMCSTFPDKFEKGKQYLIFTEGENFEVRNYCTYSQEIYSRAANLPDWYKGGLNRQRKLLKKLNLFGNFWFRFSERLGLT